MNNQVIPCKHDLLRKANNKLRINPRLYMDLSMFLDKTDEIPRLSGRRCSVIVASAIYIFCKENHGFTQKEIAEVMGVTEVSIRNTMKVIIKHIPEEKVPDLRITVSR